MRGNLVRLEPLDSNRQKELHLLQTLGLCHAVIASPTLPKRMVTISHIGAAPPNPATCR